MKFFHLSDLHIGLKIFNRELYEDQKEIFAQIVDLAVREEPDGVVIAGDIYDKAVPSAEAVELFDWFISELRRAVPRAELMLISGNHDSAPRVNIYRGILRHQKIHMIGMPPQKPSEHIEKVVLRDAFGEVNFYLLPFVKPSMVKAVVGTDEHGNNLSYQDTLRALIHREAINWTERNVLVSHQFYLPVSADAADVERMDSEICTVGNIDGVKADVLEGFDYGALGHIHKPMEVGCEAFRYCGTPLACSVSEAGQQKGVIMVELGAKGSLTTMVLPLTPRHQVRVLTGMLEEVLTQSCDDYVSVTLTDPTDLDVMDMQDKLRKAFPNLLEIRRSVVRGVDYSIQVSEEKDLDPYDWCCSFLNDLDEEEQLLLRDVINASMEVEK